MNLSLKLCLATGALIAAACGDDSNSADDDNTRDKSDASSSSPNNDAGTGGKSDAATQSTESPSTGSSGGKCGKGAYKSDGPIEIEFCGASDADDSCPALTEFEGYTTYAGDLNLYPTDDADLSHASCLKAVTGNLTISDGTEVTSLDALSNVESLAGLDILGMDKLTKLGGFNNLKNLLELTINANDSLQDVAGLPKGLTVESLYVGGNKSLTSLDGLVASGLKITKTLSFTNNPKLSSCLIAKFAKTNYPDAELSAFENLTEQCD